MNMKQLLASLLMILFINGFVHAAEDDEMDKKEYFPLSFTNKLTISEWATKLYAPVEKLVTDHHLSKEDITKIQKVIQSYVSELDILEGKMDLLELESLLPPEYHQLNEKYMSHVDRSYDNIVTHGFHKRNISKLDNFFDSEMTILIQGLPKLLNDMQEFVEGNISTYNDEEFPVDETQIPMNPKSPCLRGIPNRHKMYLLYTQVLLTEMKGFATMLQTYARKVSVEGKQEDYTRELTAGNENFKRRLDKYHIAFIDIIGRTSQQVYRCHKLQPRRGIDFIELEHFSRIQILHVLNPYQSGSCKSCKDVHRVFSRNNVTIYDCKDADSALDVCRPIPGSSRDYTSLKGSAHRYGAATQCDPQYQMISDALSLRSHCPLCACSVDLNRTEPDFSHAIWRISVTEQISDIWNNMVVTGMKLVTRENAVHLQIQQAKFSDDALSSSKPMWKKLDIVYDGEGKKTVDMKYERLYYFRKSLNIDAIKLPDGYVVTGVRFKIVRHAFKLQIHGTPFDIETAELDVSNSQWYDAIDSPVIPNDYLAERSRIPMKHADDPTKGGSVIHDFTSNNEVQFTHTDLIVDAGQTTIPLLDAQPVKGRKPFPFSGAGLYMRKVGAGAYVALRAYSLDIIPYLNMKKVHNEVAVP